jgi:hypothetical protein
MARRCSATSGCSYVDIQRIIEPLFLPGRLNYWKANFVDELSDELIDVLIDAMTRVRSPHTFIAIEPIIQPPQPQWLGGPPPTPT